MKKFLVLLILSVLSLTLFSGVKNKDKPLKGEWDLQLEKVWEVDKAGEDLLARPGGLLVTEDGAVFLTDRKYRRSYIFGKDGGLKRVFATKGEGPGEVKIHMSSFLAPDAYVISDFERLHYFNFNGDFLHSVPNHFFRRKPDIFLNRDVIISCPVNVRDIKKNKVAVRKINIKTNDVQVITEYELWTGGSIAIEGVPRREVRIQGLSPMMILGKGDNRFFYGFNDSYEITVCDFNGKKVNSFSVDREKTSITNAQKKELLSTLRNTPEIVFKYLMKHFPVDKTYFHRIEEHGGLVYVFIPDPLYNYPGRQLISQIDIFSADGAYLYKTHVNLGEGLKASISQFQGDFLYTIARNEDGEPKLVKYKIKRPK
jgi:hypothetical protein